MILRLSLSSKHTALSWFSVRIFYLNKQIEIPEG